MRWLGIGSTWQSSHMTPARDPKQVFSINLDNHGREIRKEESWRRNHGAGFLGGIWEAFGKMRWDEMKWDEMRWNEMKWDEMKWDEMIWNEMKWDELKWDEMKWNEMKWNELRWDEMRSGRHLGGIWEASGRHMGGIWGDLAGRSG